jgi:hypothetical protein
MQLQYDNDGRAENLGCHNVPPSVNEANDLLLDSARNAREFTTSSKVISAAVCDQIFGLCSIRITLYMLANVLDSRCCTLTASRHIYYVTLLSV